MSNKPKRARAAIPASPKQARSAATPARTPIIIGAVVAVILVVGLIVALVVSGGGDDDDEVARHPVTQNGVAICDAADPSDTPADEGAEDPEPLAPFPSDDLLKPVRVVGEPLPDFGGAAPGGDVDAALCVDVPIVEGYDYGGDVVTIDPTSEGPTMVVLLAHWCPHCNDEIPVLNAWRDAGEIPDDLNIVGVSTGVRPGEPNFPPDRWLVDKDWQWPVIADDGDASVMRAFGGTSYPTMLFVGSDGRLRARVSGEYPAEAIAAIVDDVFAEEERSATDPA